MQTGFAFLESGSVRKKNAKNLLIKNVIDTCGGMLVFFAFGYGFAFGDVDTNGFVGYRGFFKTDDVYSQMDESSYRFFII
jgi:Amt family ammonium transporter